MDWKATRMQLSSRLLMPVACSNIVKINILRTPHIIHSKNVMTIP